MYQDFKLVPTSFTKQQKNFIADVLKDLGTVVAASTFVPFFLSESIIFTKVMLGFGIVLTLWYIGITIIKEEHVRNTT